MKMKEWREEWENVRKWWRFKGVFIGEMVAYVLYALNAVKKSVKLNKTKVE